MIEKLEQISERYDELNQLLGDPAVASDPDQYRVFAKEHSELGAIVSCYRSYQKTTEDLEGSEEILRDTQDAEMRELAQAEVAELKESKEKLYEELLVLLLPKDPNDDKNIIMELRAGAGGDESALFAEDLFSMYCRFAESHKWKVEVLDSSVSSVGGYKEMVAQITGVGAYSFFKYESGVHRVQRVPKTETQGRVHTSTVTVAVLPEAEDVEIDIQDKDLRVDVFRSSGPGGQSVNTTDSAVRVTHIPTGIVATCQDGKSQHKNKDKAMTVLRSRLFEIKQAELDSERSQDRRSQIGSGQRSEKIRTYNFPQGRVTDHRISLTIYQLDSVLGGELSVLLDPLIAHDRAEKLQDASNS